LSKENEENFRIKKIKDVSIFMYSDQFGKESRRKVCVPLASVRVRGDHFHEFKYSSLKIIDKIIIKHLHISIYKHLDIFIYKNLNNKNNFFLKFLHQPTALLGHLICDLVPLETVEVGNFEGLCFGGQLLGSPIPLAVLADQQVSAAAGGWTVNWLLKIFV
jgi:hypothetical protein